MMKYLRLLVKEYGGNKIVNKKKYIMYNIMYKTKAPKKQTKPKKKAPKGYHYMPNGKLMKDSLMKKKKKK